MPVNYKAISETESLVENEERQKLPMRAVVNRPLPDLEAVSADMPMTTGQTRLKVRHPYMGVNSWIRVMPERGTTVYTQRRGDSTREEIAGYLLIQGPERIKRAKKGEVIYRPLDPGELEIMSGGRAYAFYGSRGDVEMRGGSLRLDLSQSRLEIQSLAPTFARRLHKWAPSTLPNQERFGVIKRPDQKNPNLLQVFIKDSNANFAMEYSRWLSDGAGKELTELQEGHVVDSTGQFAKQGSTNKELRLHRRWYHRQSGDLIFQIDNEMNVLCSNSTQAKETKLDLGDKNVLKLFSQDVKFNISKTGTYQYGSSLTTKTPTIKTTALTSFTLRSPQVLINSPSVGFGSAPSIPLALSTGVTAVVSPSLQTLVAFFNIMGADPAFAIAFPAISAAAKVTAAALSAALGAASQIPSTQLLASG